MTRIITAIAAVAMHAVSATASTPAHVIITAGQSNTDGRVKNTLLPDYIKQYATDTTCTDGAYPHCKISQNNADGHFTPYWPKGRITEGIWGYDAVVYHMIENALDSDFYVVKWAVGGTSIAYPDSAATGRYWSADPEWLASTTSTSTGGKSLLLSFTEAIDAAIDSTLSKLPEGYTIDTFLWHQGESDSKHPANYYKNLKGVIDYVRRHLTAKTGRDYSALPFVFGTVARSNRQYHPDVEAAMRRIAEEDANAWLIDMSDAELQSDRLHFTASSAERLGREMFRVLDKQLDLGGTGFTTARYKGDRRAAVSYTFDDGLIEQYTLVAPRMEQLGMRGTFFINGAKVNGPYAEKTDTTRVSWLQLKEMAERGHEVSNHGWRHKNFSRFPLEEIRDDIYKNDSAIMANIGVAATTFCYPNNNKQPDARKIAEQNRVGTRTVQRAIGGRSTSDDLDRWVDDLIATGGWGVGMTHGITFGYDHFADPNVLWEHLEKVKNRADSVWTGTFREVAAYTREQQALDYEVESTATGLRVTPRLALDKTLFDQPLTGVVRRPGKVTASQDGKKLNTTEHADKTTFEFNPYGGPIDININPVR